MAISKRMFVLGLGAFLFLVAAGSPASASRGERLVYEGYDVSAGGLLSVDVPDADIELREYSGARVIVEVYLQARYMEWAKGRFDEMNFSTVQDKGGVTIRADRVGGSWGEWRRGGFSVTVVVKLPRDFNVDARTQDGDLTLQRLEGAATLITEDGDIYVNSIDGPAIELRTSDGDVTARHLVAGRIEVHSSDGDIRLEGVDGALEAKTQDGDIVVDIERFDRTDLRTEDGDVVVNVPESLGADLRLRGEDVSLSRSADFDGSRRDGRIEGRLNGGGPELAASTGDGDVVLRLN